MTRSRALLSPYLLIGVLLLCAGCPDATLGSTSDGGVDSKVDLAAPVCANQIVDGKLNVDIPTITLTGRITVNGVVPPAERFGTVTLRNSTTGDSVSLGTLTDASYLPKQIIPGVYDVYYAWDTTDTVNPPALPRNQKALIRSGVTLTSTQTFNVDIPTVTLSGQITVNGVVPPAERFGTVTLRNSTTGDSVALGTLTDASYTPKQIIPGVYDVYYAWDTTDTVNPPALPRNQKALIRSGVTLTSTQTFNVDIQAITLTGRITVNGVVPPAERFGTVTLRNSTTGDSVSLGTVTDASYLPKQIVPGVYDVYYAWDTTDTVNPPALPRNQKALIRSGVTLTSTQTFNVDIPTVTLSGQITVNGVVPPAERFGTVTLRNSTTGDSVALGTLTDASYTPKQIIPGVYDVFYSWDTTDTVNPPALPRNQKALIRSGVTLTSTQTFNVDIPTITLTGRITVNGVVPPAERFGTVTLRNSTTGDSVALGMLTDASYTPKQIIPGVYDVYYAWDTTDTVNPPALPRNLQANLGCVSILR